MVDTAIDELKDELEDIGLDTARIDKDLDDLRSERRPAEPGNGAERVDPAKQIAKGAAFGLGKQGAEKAIQEAAERCVVRWLGRDLPTWDGVTVRFLLCRLV